MAGGVSAFMLFSSVSAVLGGGGQANYAAANICLDAMSAYRSMQGTVSASVSWGAWAEVGMASRGAASERMAAMEAAQGFSRIALAQGLGALAVATQHDSPSSMCLVPIVWSKFLGKTDAVPSLLSAFEPATIKTSSQMASAASDGPEAQGGVSLETVLEVAINTAGGAVDADMPLMEAGIDSLGSVELRNQLQTASGSSSLPSTLVFDYPTARQLAGFLQPKDKAKPASKPAGDVSSAGAMSTAANVSVDGISAFFPHGATSLQTTYLLVGCGSDVIQEVPLSRWDVNVDHANLVEPIASKVRHTGFVHGAELADNTAFNISPSETVAMDPCQRLLLERGYEALHDALHDRVTLNGALTGVFLGFSGTEFAALIRHAPLGRSVYAATGYTPSIACGRL
eukprot:7391690-Prymnesium_polylepis.1